MESEKWQCPLLLANQLIFLTHHQIIADGRKVYMGYSDRKARHAFLSAGKSGARQVSHIVNGIEMAFSRAV